MPPRSGNGLVPPHSTTEIRFYNAGFEVRVDRTAPYTATVFNAGVGTYTLKARAQDNYGGFAFSPEIQVTVIAAAPPTVSLTAPATGATYTAPATIAMSADASSTSTTISRVDFYLNNVLMGSAATAPYTFSVSNLAAASYAVKATAVDAGQAAARFEELDRTIHPLGCGESGIRNLFPLYQQIHAEATSIASTDLEIKQAEKFQIFVDSAVYGPEEARKRRVEREQGRASMESRK